MAEGTDDGVTGATMLAGRYRVEHELGRGGMATVFKGTDTVLGRPVAVKVLAPQYASDANFVTRFRREAQAAARLNHPELVSVYDTGTDDGTHFIVMEFVDAKTLADYLAGGGRILPDRAIEIAESVCDALSVAHSQGIIHRDIKPANIMITPRGDVKVTDFGIARVVSGADTLAQTAAVLGTASYLSPEQAQSQPVDQRSDLYSLGVVLYEMVTGRPPFSGDSPVMVASKHVLEQPTPPTKLNPDVSPALEAVIMKAMAKNPENRYENAEEMKADLQRARQGQPVMATPLLAESAATQRIGPSGPPTAVLPPRGPEGEERRWWIPVLIVVLVLAVLGSLAFLAWSLLRNNAVSVKVPDVRGFTQAAATRTLTNDDFKVDPVTRVTQNPNEVGIVLEQSPAADALAPKGSTVTITVGKAPVQVQVPDLTGKTQDEAAAALQQAHLKLGGVSQQPSDQPVGTVISQDPPAGQPAAKGSKVNIVLSSGPGEVTVPDVRCESFNQARKDLKAVQLNATISSETVFNPFCPSGNKVADQDPHPGDKAKPGDTVTLFPGATSSPSPSPGG